MPGPDATSAATPGGPPLQVWHVLARDALAGTELMTATLAERSAPHGIETTVVTLDEPGPIAARLTAAGITVHSLGGAGERAATLALARLVRRKRVDVLCGYGFRTGLATRMIARAVSPRTRTVTGVRGLYVTEIESLDDLRGRFVMGVERATARLVDAYVANSSGALEVLREHGIAASRLHLIVNGIEADLWRAPDRTDRDGLPIVLCAGRFVPVKRQTDLIAAAGILLKRGVRARWAFAGDGPLQAEAVAQAADVGLAGDVDMLGMLPRPQLADALARADVACLVSSQEGMPGSVMEAMASGLPVVGTQVNGIADLVVDGETGRLVPWGDPAALADALEPLLTDGELRRRLGAAGRERIVGAFSVEQMVAANATLHRQLAARPAR